MVMMMLPGLEHMQRPLAFSDDLRFAANKVDDGGWVWPHGARIHNQVDLRPQAVSDLQGIVHPTFKRLLDHAGGQDGSLQLLEQREGDRVVRYTDTEGSSPSKGMYR